MDTVARTGALATRLAPRRLPLPVAGLRSLDTIREVIACRRAIARGIEARCSMHDRARLLHEASQRLGDRLGLCLRVRGLVPQGPAVLVANHIGYLDPMAVAQALPIGAIAKAELAGWPGLGKIFQELGIIFVERGNPASGATALRKAMRILAAELPVLVFPEGTTSMGRDVLPFRRGAFGLAQIAGVPVVPVTLRYSFVEACWVGSAAFLPHFVSLHRRPQVDAELVFGSPIAPTAGPDADSLGALARHQIQSVLSR